MRELSANERKKLWEEVRKEFPDDEMMQQIHYVRLMHHRQIKDLSPQEVVQFFENSYKRTTV